MGNTLGRKYVPKSIVQNKQPDLRSAGTQHRSMFRLLEIYNAHAWWRKIPLPLAIIENIEHIQIRNAKMNPKHRIITSDYMFIHIPSCK